MVEKLFLLIKDCEMCLDEESINEVMHFFNHGEYEMSLEGLMIEMIAAEKYPPNISTDIINELAIHYRLNVESVFDCNIWEKFENWIKKW